MAKLGVNIDHVATLREARQGSEPDPVAAAAVVEMAGADGITVHLREDRRHIQDRDLRLLNETIKTRLNLEMAPTDDMLKVAQYIKPFQATLVPERREEVTTEGGLDVAKSLDSIKKTIATLKEAEIRSSLFIDPDLDQVKAAHRADADGIEIHTGQYALANSPRVVQEELYKIDKTIAAAKKFGLIINAGHGINYHNIEELARFKDIEEFNIGHSIISRAVFVGLDAAVREMVDLIRFYSEA